MGLIRVLLVDDHPAIVTGLAAAIAREEDVDVVGVATTLAEARTALADLAPDVGLLDIRLPDGSGLDLLAETATLCSWIILSTFEYPQYVARAVKAGAAGYLLKTATLPEVLGAIRGVAAGGTAFPARYLDLAARTAIPSARQLEVIRALADGCSNEEIASRVGLTTKTVETYLSRMYAQFDAPSRTELATRALREGWLE